MEEGREREGGKEGGREGRRERGSEERDCVVSKSTEDVHIVTQHHMHTHSLSSIPIQI